jgi:hypothetical protein
MTHKHEERGSGRHIEHAPRKRSIHKDWRLWAVVIVMLGAMAIYVMTMDEAVAPGVRPGAEVPAAP